MRNMANITVNPYPEHAEGLRRDIQIFHLWQHQIDIIIDLRVTETDAKAYLNRPLETVLEVPVH